MSGSARLDHSRAVNTMNYQGSISVNGPIEVPPFTFNLDVCLVLSELVDQVQMVYDRRILSKEMI